MTALTLIGCQKAPTKSTHMHVLKTNFVDDPKTFDPRKGADPIASTVHFMLYEGLTRFLPDASVEPAAAEFWTLSEDKKIYTFTLRKSVWSDGSPVTAQDFEDSWKKILSPDFFSPNAHLLYPIKNGRAVKKGEMPIEALGIHSLDDRTLQVELETPTPYFLGLTAFCVLFPAKCGLDEKSPNWANPQTQQIVTNGPFVLREYKAGQSISLDKNKAYWDEKSFHLDGIEISIVRDSNTAIQLFEQKQLHIIGGSFSPLSQEQIAVFKGTQELYSRPTASSSVVFFNTEKGPLSNVHIRRALAFAIDRQSIVDHILQLGQSVALEAVPFSLKKERKPHLSEHPLAQAKVEFEKGLEELQIDRSAFQNLTVTYFDSPQQQSIAQTLQKQWRDALGIELTIRQVDWNTFLDILNRRDFEIGQYFYWAQYPDPMNILERFQFKSSPKNYCNWESNRFSDLLKQSFLAAENQRDQILEEAENILFEEMPFSALYHDKSAFLLQKNVKNFHQTVIGTICYKDLEIEND